MKLKQTFVAAAFSLAAVGAYAAPAFNLDADVNRALKTFDVPGMAIAIVLLIAVLVGGFYLFSRGGAENRRDAAVTSAAKSVGDTAKKAGDAISGDAK